MMRRASASSSAHCGINIAGVINVDEVTRYARSLPHVVLAENNLFSCSARTPRSS